MTVKPGTTTTAQADPPATTSPAAGADQTAAKNNQDQGVGANGAANSDAKKNTDPTSDEDEDWVSSNEHLTDGQKKHIKKLTTQHKNAKERVRELEAEKSEREAAEAEAKRQKDIEEGNHKKIAEENQKEASRYKEKLIRAELKHAAQKAGLKDMADVDLIPSDEIKTDKDGNVLNADAVMKKWKESKPHWFKEEDTTPPPQGTTNGGKGTPNAQTTQAPPKNAMDMSDEEFRAHKAELTKNEKKF